MTDFLIPPKLMTKTNCTYRPILFFLFILSNLFIMNKLIFSLLRVRGYNTRTIKNPFLLPCFFLCFYFLLTNTPSVLGQSFCETKAGTSSKSTLPVGDCDTDFPGPYYIKVYVHVIREDDGAGGFSGGQPESSIRRAFEILAEDYSPLIFSL